jgi:hypothetical protein
VDLHVLGLGGVCANPRLSEPLHVEWVKSYHAILEALEEYIKKYHQMGVTWNAKGVDASQLLASKAAGAPPPPGPTGGGPPPPPPPPPPPHRRRRRRLLPRLPDPRPSLVLMELSRQNQLVEILMRSLTSSTAAKLSLPGSGRSTRAR